jgi:hypothetical protein
MFKSDIAPGTLVYACVLMLCLLPALRSLHRDGLRTGAMAEFVLFLLALAFIDAIGSIGGSHLREVASFAMCVGVGMAVLYAILRQCCAR